MEISEDATAAMEELSAEIPAPRDDEAVATDVLVFALITAASEVVAVRSAVSVCAFVATVPADTATPSDDEAFCTSPSVASDPTDSPAPVSVRVPDVQISAASVPKVVSERPEYDQMSDGMLASVVASELIDEPSVLTAVLTALFVFPFTVVTAVATCVFVFPFTTAAIEEVAV
jgi:hypothetical protein